MTAYRRYTFARNDLLFTMSDNTRMQAARGRDALHARISFHGRALDRSPPSLMLRRATFAVRGLACQPKRPRREGWWSQTESNRRPPACKAGALPTELWPLVAVPNSVGAAAEGYLAGLPSRSSRQPARLRHSASARQPPLAVASEGWWAWEDLNFRPHAYQARALTN